MSKCSSFNISCNLPINNQARAQLADESTILRLGVMLERSGDLGSRRPLIGPCPIPMGAIIQARAVTVHNVTDIGSVRDGVRFHSDDGFCEAWLFRPRKQRCAPLVVMAHGLGGTRDMRLDAYAERFTAAGYSCLVFDYRHFGASPGEPRQLIDIRRQLVDWSSALTWARADPRTAGQRIVLWGTSFSGGHVLRTAAVDRRIAAVIVQCPFTDGIASTLAMDPVTAVKVTARGVADLLASRMGRAPVRVAIAGPPRSAALMSAPDALSGVLALTADPTEYANDTPARVALHIPFHRPGRAVSKVACPIFIGICENDSVAPAQATARYARKADCAEVVHYRAGHFGVYIGAAFEVIVKDQLAFLARHAPLNEQVQG